MYPYPMDVCIFIYMKPYNSPIETDIIPSSSVVLPYCQIDHQKPKRLNFLWKISIMAFLNSLFLRLKMIGLRKGVKTV